MKKVIFLGFFVVLLFTQCKSALAQSTNYSEEVNDRIKKVENRLMCWVQTQDTLMWTLKERMAFYNVQGLSIAVINNYEIEWAKGYGWADTSEHRPVTTQTLFQAASISKSLNGIGVLKLVQDNKLDLNADINEYLKSWKFPYDSNFKSKKITVANLLSHTAGLTIHGFPGYKKDDSLPSIIDILNGREPSNTKAVCSQLEPGFRFQYSGGGILISQLIIMDITNQPYDEYMFQNVLKPLGMNSSFYTQPPTDDKNQLLATAYHTNGRIVNGRYHIYPEQAAAGLWTNPTDLSNYIIETQLSYQNKSSKVLNSEMTKLRLTPYLDSSSALGVFIENRGTEKYFQHSGGNEGFCCKYYGSIDDGKGVVIMSNSDNRAILEEIANSVAFVYKWKDFYNPVIKQVIELPDTILSLYVGKYMLDKEPVIISMESSKLFLKYMNVTYKIFFTSSEDFFIPELEGNNKFLKDIHGKICGYSINDKTVLNKEK
jgi:CubicO group peptidase (beta-lactamase class C family)